MALFSKEKRKYVAESWRRERKQRKRMAVVSIETINGGGKAMSWRINVVVMIPKLK